MTRDRNDETDDRLEHLPEHEIDRDPIVGGGVLITGGVVIDRGTGTIDGQAQDIDLEVDPRKLDDEEDLDGDPVGDDTKPGIGIEAEEGDPDKVVPAPYFRA